MKKCHVCKHQKSIENFGFNKSKKDGLNTACKLCAVIKAVEWGKKNKEKRKKITEKYRQNNKEKCNEATRKSQAKNPDSPKNWVANNREKVNLSKRKWILNNPEKNKEVKANNKSKRKYAVGKISFGFVEKLLFLQKSKCACCKKPLGNDYHIDHIMPLALGGTNTDDNIQLLRSKCNLQKNAKHPVDFMQSRGYLL